MIHVMIKSVNERLRFSITSHNKVLSSIDLGEYYLEDLPRKYLRDVEAAIRQRFRVYEYQLKHGINGEET